MKILVENWWKVKSHATITEFFEIHTYLSSKQTLKLYANATIKADILTFSSVLEGTTEPLQVFALTWPPTTNLVN